MSRFQRILGPSQFESRLPWGPVMAVLLVALITVVLSLADLLANWFDLLPRPPRTITRNPDGITTISIPVPYVHVSKLLEIPLLLLAASRLRVNPLDALALRWPARPGRTLLVVGALLALEYGLRVIVAVGFAIYWFLWVGGPAALSSAREFRGPQHSRRSAHRYHHSRPGGADLSRHASAVSDQDSARLLGRGGCDLPAFRCHPRPVRRRRGRVDTSATRLFHRHGARPGAAPNREFVGANSFAFDRECDWSRLFPLPWVGTPSC